MSSICENYIFLFLLQMVVLGEHLREASLGSSQILIYIHVKETPF